MKLFISFFICLLFSGCFQFRETSLALQQSDQAQEAVQKKLAHDIAPVVVHLPPELQATVKQALDDACLLLATSRDAIRPALALSQGTDPAPESRTSAELAYGKPQEFARQAAIQTGRAHAEVDHWVATVRGGEIILQYSKALSGDLLSQLLLLLGGGGLAGGVGVKLFTVYRSIKQATKDAVSFGNDALNSDTPEQKAATIEKHKALQANNKTRDFIKSLGALSRQNKEV